MTVKIHTNKQVKAIAQSFCYDVMKVYNDCIKDCWCTGDFVSKVNDLVEYHDLELYIKNRRDILYIFSNDGVIEVIDLGLISGNIDLAMGAEFGEIEIEIDSLDVFSCIEDEDDDNDEKYMLRLEEVKKMIKSLSNPCLPTRLKKRVTVFRKDEERLFSLFKGKNISKEDYISICLDSISKLKLDSNISYKPDKIGGGFRWVIIKKNSLHEVIRNENGVDMSAFNVEETVVEELIEERVILK